MLSHAYDDGGGFSVCATVGNQADIDACDFIDYFAEDPLHGSSAPISKG
jgi:acyl-CoA synthetase (NDP forming)